jgi:hypothetical protein
MADGGRHRSDRPPGLAGWATVVGLVLLAVVVATAVVLGAVLLL